MYSLPGFVSHLPPEVRYALFDGKWATLQSALPKMIDDVYGALYLNLFAHCVAGMRSITASGTEQDPFPIQAMELALEQGASLEYLQEAQTLLSRAVARGSMPMAKLLLSKGAQLEPDEVPLFPLMWAVSNNDRKMMEWLLSEGANPNASDVWGRTVAHSATHGQSQRLLPILIQAGANLHSLDEKGGNIIHAWVQGCLITNKGMIPRDVKTLHKLAGWGVDLAHADHQGKTPVDWALAAGQHGIVQALEHCLALDTAKTMDQQTAPTGSSLRRHRL